MMAESCNKAAPSAIGIQPYSQLKGRAYGCSGLKVTRQLQLNNQKGLPFSSPQDGHDASVV
jgi:hypothetical protein